MIYWSCLRSVMLCGSETWCLRENEMAILRSTERAMVRAMCGANLMEKKRTEDLMEMLGLKETVVQMAKANGVRWNGHVLMRDDGYVLRKVLVFEVKGKRSEDDQRRRGRHKWRRRARVLVWRRRMPYPRKWGWLDLPHSNSNLSNSHSPFRSIHGILLLQTNTLALLLHLCVPHLLWLSSFPLTLYFKLQWSKWEVCIFSQFR